MIIATFKTHKDEYNTYVFDTAEGLQNTIEITNSIDAVTGIIEK